jgi:hypothetical protein
MDKKARLLSLNPRLQHDEIERCIEGGERYAVQFDKIPPHDRESIAYLFAAYCLTDSMHYKLQIRRGIDVVLAPFYPGARP